MKRVAGREVEGAPHETLLVVDAVTGQNGLEQARQFLKVAGVTGIVLTKLDGTAKGGIAVAIAKELGLPIRYAGIGEKVDDLVVFDPETYEQPVQLRCDDHRRAQSAIRVSRWAKEAPETTMIPSLTQMLPTSVQTLTHPTEIDRQMMARALNSPRKASAR
jgi:hypothetical protein